MMSKGIERHLKAYGDYVFAIAEELAAKPPKNHLQSGEMTLLDYYRNINIDNLSENRKAISFLIKHLKRRLERIEELYILDYICEETYKRKVNEVLQEKEYLEQQSNGHEFLPQEVINRFAIELTYDFQLLWELRWLAPIECKNYIYSLIKDMRMSCKIREIDFDHLDEPYLEDRVKLTVERRLKRK